MVFKYAVVGGLMEWCFGGMFAGIGVGLIYHSKREFYINSILGDDFIRVKNNDEINKTVEEFLDKNLDNKCFNNNTISVNILPQDCLDKIDYKKVCTATCNMIESKLTNSCKEVKCSVTSNSDFKNNMYFCELECSGKFDTKE